MRNYLKKVLALTAAVVALSSCRSWILEDRSDCPGYLFFEFIDRQSLGDPEFMHLEAVSAEDRVVLNKDTTTVGAMDDKSYCMPVRKTSVLDVYGLSGFSRSRVQNGTQWIIPYGQDGDPLYHFASRTEATGETMIVPVEMTKEYSTITVKFKMYEGYGNEGTFPFSIVVVSNTVGLDIQSGAPVRGDFRFVPEENQDGVFQFTVPRQADQTLSMEIWAKEGVYDEVGHVDDMVFWNFLKEVEGFSWSLKNLPDLTIEIDYVRSKVVVYVNDWQLGTSINYEI